MDQKDYNPDYNPSMQESGLTKFIKKHFSIIVGIIIVCLIATSIGYASNYFMSTSAAEKGYVKAVEVESDAYSYYLLTKRERCYKESILAKAKVLDYFGNDRELAEGEDLNALVEKAEWTCDQDLPDESGNFISSEGGIESFLKVNGAENVKGAKGVFEATGLLYDIKPEMIVCIAQADSQLGKYLKTANNIGNVGNTDGGATWTPNTLNQGIAAMGRTLTNQWLGSYTKLGELSNGGRNILEMAPCGIDGAKCYATSSYNWNKNVKLCLRDILQDNTIDENYNFRTITKKL